MMLMSDIPAEQSRELSTLPLSSLVHLVEMLNSPSVLVNCQHEILAYSALFEHWPLLGIASNSCALPGLFVQDRTILDDLAAVMFGGRPDTRLMSMPESNVGESVFEVSYHGLCLGSEQISHCLVHVTDVTEKEKAKQKLLSANDELTQLQYHLSHDLVAPIASANGLLNLIKEDVVANQYSEIEDLTNETMLQLKRLKDLVSDLMSLARAGAAISENTQIDLRELIDEIVQSISLHDRVLEISVTLDFDKAHLFCDRIRIKQILMNLISNARKFADAAEEAPEIIVKAEGFLDYTRICVSDNGLGVGDNLLSGLFGMFTRGATGAAGHGLGLYIVHKHIQHLGGTVRLLNQAKPTVFELIIPIAPEH